MPCRKIIVLAASAALSGIACGLVPLSPIEPAEETGLPVLSMRWKFKVADHSRETKPQEFSSAAVANDTGGEMVYAGSSGGRFYALSADGGEVIWERKIGSVSSRPLVDAGKIYLGTDDGFLLCLSTTDGSVKWRYATRGSILRQPVLVGDLVVFSNEADHVYALDRDSGKFRWQYKTETPEEFTLRGHAGVAVDGDLVFTGFADGTLVALRTASGTVAWIKSLKGDADRFVDVDATPVVQGEVVYASSSAGGVYGLDRTTGLIRWHLPMKGAGGLATDGEHLYGVAAEQGVFAMDFGGHILWRQGTRGGGEPARPVVSGSYLLYSLSDAGLFIADKRTGNVYQYFDPGFGISSAPTIAGDAMFVMSNSAILYTMRLNRFD